MSKAMHGGNVWQGKDPAEWLDYSANIRPGGPPDWVKKCLRNAIAGAGYYPPLDMHRARKGLAEYLGLEEGFVLPTAGGASAIELATRCGMERVILCSPCFGEYRGAAERAGLPVESVNLLASARRIASPAEVLEDVLGSHTLIWICSPMNPVGHSFSRQEIEDLLVLSRRMQGRVALDEAFIDFCPGASLRDMIRTWPELMITGSLTKILGIPGVRLGYLCAQDAQRLGDNALPWELNCFAEQVAMELPAHREEMRKDAQDSMRRTLSFSEELSALGFYVYPSVTNFVLVDLGREAAPVAEALKERKILVRECPDFEGVNDGMHLRLAVKDEKTNRIFLKNLKEILTCAENR